MFDSIADAESSDTHPGDLYHVGRVVLNNDPNKQQRVKVVIPGYLVDSNYSNLPWVGPIAHSDFGNTSAFGSVRVPVVGSLLILKFQGGDRSKGLYVGYACTAAMGNAMPPELSTNYPNRYGYWDPKGNVAYTDMTTGESEFKHNSGAIVHFTAAGLINITGNITIAGNVTISGDLIAGSVTTAAGIGLAPHHHSGTGPALP